jgi:probable lipoprotein NlpC
MRKKPNNITIVLNHQMLCKLGFYLNLLALVLFFMLSACSTAPGPVAPPAVGSAHPFTAKSYLNDAEIEQRLRREYGRWQGTRHRLGGTGSRGVDCSGFVKAIYKDVFNVDLPRTTRAQVKQGRPIPFKELQAGDLVFFQPPTYPRHVGIYLGGSEFVHASKNKGVTLSRIDETYWGKYYWTARRILSAAGHP